MDQEVNSKFDVNDSTFIVYNNKALECIVKDIMVEIKGNISPVSKEFIKKKPVIRYRVKVKCLYIDPIERAEHELYLTKDELLASL